MITIKDVTVRYGNAHAVRAASFTAPSGQVTAIVGPNGAGKTSLMSAAFGSIPATGRVEIDGEDLSSTPAGTRLRKGLAYVPQGRQLFPRLTVRENLEIGARLVGSRNSVLDSAFESFPILRTRQRQLAGVLSGGEQQMLVLARALLVTPSVLLLDEMTTGLSPKITGELLDRVRDLADSGVTVVVAEPALHRVAKIVDRGYVMMRGAVTGPEQNAAALDAAYRSAMGVLEQAL